MKNKIIIIAILLAPILLSAQNGSMRQDGPEIVFDETIFDFDTIAQNGSGEHVFYFTNSVTDKKSVLRIKGVVVEPKKTSSK